MIASSPQPSPPLRGREGVWRGRQAARWLGPLLIAGAFLLAATLTWRKWPDVLVDFGMQLYLPWKISQGMALYHDAKYLTGGPFSQYFNALLFKIFGASLMTLAIANLLIAAGLITLIYRRFLAAADALTATMISLGIVLVFAFAQYYNVANYNYITPYSHEVWHGLVLSIVAITLLSNWAGKRQVGCAAGAGFCSGLVFMTKPDVFFALAMGITTAFALVRIMKAERGFVLKSLAAFLLCAALPLLGFLFYFHNSEGWNESLRSVCFAWVPLLGSKVSETPFYKWCTGMDAPWLNFRAMWMHFSAVCGLVVISALVFRRNLTVPANRLLALAWIAGLLAMASGFDWVDCGRSLPLVGVTLCVVLFVQFWKRREAAPVFPLLWSVFALVLLAKLGLYSRVGHYGFALAMPAFVGAVYLLLWLLPQWLERLGINRRWFRSAVALVLFTGMARLFVQSQFVYLKKTTALGNDADQMLVPNEKFSPVGVTLKYALAWMEKNTPKDATLAVLPEGIMVNYLSRRTNPGHYLLWNMNELAAFGQANMTDDFENHPPDYIMLVHRDESEYGAKYFGQEEKFGLKLMRWIQTNYQPVQLIGDEPLINSSFGIKILKRVPRK